MVALEQQVKLVELAQQQEMKQVKHYFQQLQEQLFLHFTFSSVHIL